MRLAAVAQAPVERHQRLVPVERRGQRRAVERASQPASAAANMRLAGILAALMHKRRQAGDRRHLLAAELAEFRHADHDRKRGALAAAGNAANQIEAPGEVRVRAQFGEQPRGLAFTSLLQALAVGVGDAPQPRIVDMLETRLDARNVVLDLLEEGQVIRQRIEPRLGRQLVARIEQM